MVNEKKAHKRAFRPTTPDPSLEKERSLTFGDWKALGAVMIIASLVRLYKLDWPTSVVFDEVHFGKFAKKYIIGRFFFDVHPPLAKMLFGVFAYLGGFDSTNDFEFENIGDDYIGPHVPYIVMRLLPALAGLATIALCFATLRASGVRRSAATLTALILTFENTFITESRYILLDSPLVSFIALTVYAYKCCENTAPLSRRWMKYMLLTGLALGATVSSKWVGIFTLGWVGCLTAYEQWFVWGDLNVPVPRFVKAFVLKLFFLLGVPFAFYVGMFVLHFFCVDNMGDGADMLPRWFQASLKHNTLPQNVPADVAYGSLVSLRHVDTNGGWLHSHIQTYPSGSEQQQVTLYSHLDDNNLWLIENGTEISTDSLQYVKDGDIIRLHHIPTQRRLHSHDHRAPVTTHDYVFEVSGYGFEDFGGDANDNWRVKIVDVEKVGDRLQALRTYFQLEHTMLGCLLYSKETKLPEWGFGQQEVSCIRNGKLHNTVWFIESNINDALPEDTPIVNYEVPGFFQKFWALNKAMWDVNKGLTDPHYWESRPSSWVIMKRGINMWGEHNRQVYLVGNVPVYWLILASVIVFVGHKLLRVVYSHHMTGQIELYPRANTIWALFDHHFGNYALGWWFHLFPSFFMVRQLFLHHYLGSLYFGVLMIGQLIELVFSFPRYRIAWRTLVGVFFFSVCAWWLWFASLIYGTPWTKKACVRSSFFDNDFDCNLFYDSYEPYIAQKAEIKESIYSAWHGLVAPTMEAADETAEIVQEIL